MRISTLVTLLIMVVGSRGAEGGVPRFEAEQVDGAVGEVCYALAVADVDGDGRPDVVAATEDALLWYANPGWKRATILRGATRPDNVCLQAIDADGDGRVDFAVGAGWGPLGLRGTERLTWVAREGRSDVWKAMDVALIPSLHRLKAGDVLGTGRPQLVAAPLQGRGVVEPNWGDGPGVLIEVITPGRGSGLPPWPSQVADRGLHTAHGLSVVDLDGDGRSEILVAAWEGIFAIRADAQGRWSREKLGAGHGDGPIRGASEVQLGRLADGRKYLASIEPWHGSEVVVYTPDGPGPWTRRVIDADASGGHGLRCVDLDGDGTDELVVARRDPNHDLATPPDGSQILAYAPRAGSAPLAFDKHAIDPGGIAAEDLVAADLDGDGRVDLVAGGRETHNVRIYRNRGPARP